MKSRYVRWHYPTYVNPDETAALQHVSVCKVDGEINIIFRHLPPEYKPVWKLASAFDREYKQGMYARDSTSPLVMVLSAYHEISLDEVAQRLDVLARVNPAFDVRWFKEALKQDKIDAELNPDGPADFDVWTPVDHPALKRIVASASGGTIQLREGADAKIKAAILALRNPGVTFQADPQNRNKIHFHWAVPSKKEDFRREAEFVSLERIENILGLALGSEKDRQDSYLRP